MPPNSQARNAVKKHAVPSMAASSRPNALIRNTLEACQDCLVDAEVLGYDLPDIGTKGHGNPRQEEHRHPNCQNLAASVLVRHLGVGGAWRASAWRYGRGQGDTFATQKGKVSSESTVNIIRRDCLGWIRMDKTKVIEKKT